MTRPNSPSTSRDNDLPLFYENPVLLRFEEHRHMALKPANGFGFSAGANAIPLLIGEFAQAARFFPIVFTGTAPPRPYAVLGLKEGQNLFPARNGSWRAGTYVPAYLRRYPFIITDFADQGERLLAIDAASERFVEIGKSPDAQPLFDDKGVPTPATVQAMAFCNAFHQEYIAGNDLGRELKELNLLVERHADMQFPDNSRYTLNGFMVVDALKFREIADTALLLEWHKKGWLAAIELHLASTNNWEALLLLNAQQDAAEQGAA